jgi:tRNA threonylcarbamoyladenosine biosynthesis protein TsaE
MQDTIISKSPDETFALGAQFAASLSQKAVVGLIGGLGAGKTQFAKGLCAGLGVDQEVTSPTFTLIHEYPTEQGFVAHVDFYRIEDESVAARLGIDEIYSRSLCTIVEWADKFPKLLPPDVHLVSLNFPGDGTVSGIREIVLTVRQ